MKNIEKKIHELQQQKMKNERYQLSELCKKYGITEEEFERDFKKTVHEISLEAENRYIVNQGGILPFSSSEVIRDKSITRLRLK